MRARGRPACSCRCLNSTDSYSSPPCCWSGLRAQSQRAHDRGPDQFFFLANIFLTSDLGNQYNQGCGNGRGRAIFNLLDTPDCADPVPVPPPRSAGARGPKPDVRYAPTARSCTRSISSQPGQTIVWSHTGSGKTSIISLTRGFICRTGAGADRRLRHAGDRADSLHHVMGIVLQHNFLHRNGVRTFSSAGRARVVPRWCGRRKLVPGHDRGLSDGSRRRWGAGGGCRWDSGNWSVSPAMLADRDLILDNHQFRRHADGSENQARSASCWWVAVVGFP